MDEILAMRDLKNFKSDGCQVSFIPISIVN
jgi:hypothetical protein